MRLIDFCCLTSTETSYSLLGTGVGWGGVVGVGYLYLRSNTPER